MREKEPKVQPFDVGKVGQKIHDEMMHKTSAEVGPKPFKKGRFRNFPCPCGSGKKTKKCCGGE
jgi:uncharacterized protein YecA (UPF0149 family)